MLQHKWSQVIKFRPILYGVPQGSILNPLPFVIYMNDLLNSFEGTKIKMYADDINLTKQITSLHVHLINVIYAKKIVPGSTDFAVAICQIPQISKHF